MAETGLLAAIKQEVRKPGGVCGIALLNLTPAERAELDVALDRNSGIPATAIVKGLASLNHKVGDFTVNRHRRGDCSCGSG